MIAELRQEAAEERERYDEGGGWEEHERRGRFEAKEDAADRLEKALG